MGLAAIMLFETAGMDRAMAAKKNDFSLINNIWKSNSELSAITLPDITPYLYVSPSAPKKRLIRRDYSYSTNPERKPEYVIKYGSGGNIKKVEENGNVFTYNFDKKGRLLSYTQSIAGKWNLTGTVTTNDKGLITQQETEQKSGDHATTKYQYKGANIIKDTWRPSNTGFWSPTNHVRKYDAGGRLISYRYVRPKTGKAYIEIQYQYDENGRIVSAVETRDGQEGADMYTLSYDGDGYLTRMSSQHTGSDYIWYGDFVYEDVK